MLTCKEGRRYIGLLICCKYHKKTKVNKCDEHSSLLQTDKHLSRRWSLKNLKVHILKFT